MNTTAPNRNSIKAIVILAMSAVICSSASADEKKTPQNEHHSNTDTALPAPSTAPVWAPTEPKSDATPGTPTKSVFLGERKAEKTLRKFF